MGIYEILAYFFVYGVLGWCVEVAFAAVKEGRFVNRGFLNGPICPIYGVGVVSVIFSLQGFSESLLILYLASAVLVTFDHSSFYRIHLRFSAGADFRPEMVGLFRTAA